ncbi:NlpC/P60 family protein [Streptomyces sp. NPDC058280]|uniref:C40 family peptidase n=1 Tax=Streptomyces sp. NPDC058280 TaxID=3346419 RepID=UPI0036EF5216
MSGRRVRAACTAALATATVFAAVPLASHAAAEPGADPVPSASASGAPPPAAPTPSASASPTPGAAADGAVPTNTAAAPDPSAPAPSASAPSAPATSAPAAAPAATEPEPAPVAAPGAMAAPGTVSGMLTQLQRLYREAEEASEAYNATETELTRLRDETTRLGAGLTRARTALARSRVDVGRLAREQYQGRSELSGFLRLLLARDPQHAMDEGHLMERAARGRAATMARLTGGEKRADALASASRKALDKQQILATRQQRQRDMVRARLQEVERLLASLSSGQIAAVTALEKAGTDKAQRDLISSGALGPEAAPQGGGRRAPSARGGEAVEYAVEQIGKPYEWGAEGPGSFDCSGLTSQAWARAGLAIPRTSQEQWRELPRVSLDELRPGDLVIYFPTATHVAIYLGDGMVIQAPRPGSHVKVSPLAANPLLGAVRPDPAAGSLAPASYRPPELPPGAMDGTDTGYSEENAP